MVCFLADIVALIQAFALLANVSVTMDLRGRHALSHVRLNLLLITQPLYLQILLQFPALPDMDIIVFDVVSGIWNLHVYNVKTRLSQKFLPSFLEGLGNETNKTFATFVFNVVFFCYEPTCYFYVEESDSWQESSHRFPIESDSDNAVAPWSSVVIKSRDNEDQTWWITRGTGKKLSL